MRKTDRYFDVLYNPIHKLSPVEWAETHRNLTKEITNFPGKMSYRPTPYLKKIANSVMEENPAQIISVMKGSQIGWSIGGIFTILGWIMSQSPGNTLFITENDDKIKEQMQGAISQMINSSDLSHLVGNHNLREHRQAGNRRNSGTGDTTKGLTFKDGVLYTYSGQKVGSISSISAKYGLYDELERWKGIYKKAGNFQEVLEPRHRSFGSDRKLFFGSTPEIKQTSNIEPLYLSGDQQKYNIPCFHCGELIEICWTIDRGEDHAGIYYERDKNGKYKENSAAYTCQKCGEIFKEVHKFDMYEEEHYAHTNGSDLVCEWLPTATPESFIYESYHISSLYAPQGFYSWNDLARKWCEIHPINAPVRVRKLQGFYNQELGFTWEEKEREVKASQLRKNCRYYDHGTIPDIMSQEDGNGNIVAITVAIDINGEMGDKYSDGEDDVRIDYEVIAWTERGDEEYVTSYSIDQGSIGTFKRSRERKSEEKKGKLNKDVKWTLRSGMPNDVWKEFEEKVLFRDWETESGTTRRIMLCGVDTGNFTKFANDFVNKHTLCVALKGGSAQDYTKFRDQDKAFVVKGTKAKLYIVRGNLVKNILADEIELSWDKEEINQPLGFMNFPTPTKNKYQYNTFFKEFEGEHKIMEIGTGGEAVGFMWKKKHSSSPNHFFDCRMYDFALMQILMELKCKSVKPKIGVSWKNFCALYNTRLKMAEMKKE